VRGDEGNRVFVCKYCNLEIASVMPVCVAGVSSLSLSPGMVFPTAAQSMDSWLAATSLGG
jgi:hypothetical protein